MLAGMIFDQFRKIITRYKNGYNMNVTRQTACLVVNSVTVEKKCSPLYLHAGGPGLRLNEGPGLKMFN